MKNVRIKIYGRVQGVFFRINAQIEARKLSLTGWVKNEPDKSVLLEVEGAFDNLKEFIRWCQKGSPPAKVSKVDIQWKNNSEKYKEFKIIY